MTEHWTLEDELKRRSESGIDADAEDFWHRYTLVREYLASEYYRWIQATCPFYTEHGEQHITSVIQTASDMLSEFLCDEPKGKLTTLDVYLLLSAICWHDVGNAISRHNHAQQVSDMTEKVQSLGFSNLTIQRLVVSIAQAHSGQGGLIIPKNDMFCQTANTKYTVFPRSLAAILRFADEVSETRERISLRMLDGGLVPDENLVYWEYARCIASSVPEVSRSRVVLQVELEDTVLAKRFAHHDCKLLPNSNEPISMIEYLLCRLEKVNNERAYCAAEFARYLSIKQIEVRIEVFHGATSLPNYQIEFILGDGGLAQDNYPSISIFEPFFTANPMWKPEKLETLGL